MAIWLSILVAASVVVGVALLIVAAGFVRSRNRTRRLQQHFGPEYERLLAETGDQKAAEKELTNRERKREKLDIVPLTHAAQTDFSTRWHQVQTGFVDNPATAVGVADRLVTEVMRTRGYPVDDFDRRAADISVDHPRVVENYRAAHGIHVSQQGGDVSTEQQREAFVHYRALFEELLTTGTAKETNA
jgi:hypothetical protein